ncbi:MAG: CHAP domain-containing protein [Salinibacterium sp.]|nr:CHAP domain-containing protein [Salinibacterium sp.]
MDDLFGFGNPESGVTSSTDATAHPSAGTPQYGSRREARDAASRRRAKLSRPAADRRAVRVAAREIEGRGPASRKLRRNELALMRAAAPKAQPKNPLRALATMTIVGGLFAVAGLPAYAVSTADPTLVSSSAKQSALAVGSQSIVVSADATVTAATRDGYRATTQAELAEMTKDQLRAQNNADYLLSGAREMGDDYPWPYELSSRQGGGLSPLNYYFRECVDFVAWRLNRDQGSYSAPYKWVWSTLTPTGGNASQWEYAWEQHGWPISDTPIVGSVAWFGWSNHVAYVKAINGDGTVLVEEYNYVPGIYTQRTIPISSVEKFLYPPS